jgi:hypothetical protein
VLYVLVTVLGAAWTEFLVGLLYLIKIISKLLSRPAGLSCYGKHLIRGVQRLFYEE